MDSIPVTDPRVRRSIPHAWLRRDGPHWVRATLSKSDWRRFRSSMLECASSNADTLTSLNQRVVISRAAAALVQEACNAPRAGVAGAGKFPDSSDQQKQAAGQNQEVYRDAAPAQSPSILVKSFPVILRTPRREIDNGRSKLVNRPRAAT